MKLEKFKKGFGLLEVLVSAVIIIIILGSLVVIGRSAMANSIYTQERAQAIYLAQEGIEFVRQIRDTNWVDNSPSTQWDYLDGLTAMSSMASSKCYSLAWVPASGRYFLQNGNLSNLSTCRSTSKEAIIVGQTGSSSGISYNRKIFIEPSGSLSGIIPESAGSEALNSYALKVTSIVTWTSNGVTRNIQASELLTNWRPNF